MQFALKYCNTSMKGIENRCHTDYLSWLNTGRRSFNKVQYEDSKK